MKKSIALILEGTYPYARGGVGMWAHELIKRSPEYDFFVVAITDQDKGPRDYKFSLPSHVRQVMNVNLAARGRGRASLKHIFRGKKRRRELADVLRRALDAAGQGDFSRLPAFLDVFAQAPESDKDLLRTPEMWDLITQTHQALGGQDSLSRFFWAWDILTRRVLRVLRTAPPPVDAFHCASTGFAGLLGTLWKLRTGKPLVVTEHGLYLQERQMELAFHETLQGTQRRLLELFFESVSRWTYQSADRLTALCQPIRQQQIALGANPEKTAILPNGIDVAAFSQIPRQEGKGFRIGLVGRVVPVKDVKLLILAARELLPHIPDLTVAVKGSWDDMDYLEECRDLSRSLGLNGRVTFTGHVDPKICYADLDLLVICSLKEVQPLAVLEAMAAGVPVVATRSGGVPEILSNTGRVINPRSLDQLVKAIRQVHDNAHLRQRMIDAGRRRAKESFDIAHTLSHFHTLYNSLMEKPWPALA